MYILQGPNDFTCGQCCVASYLNISLPEAIDLIDKDNKTTATDLDRGLRKYGFALLPAKLVRKGNNIELPASAIIRMKYKETDEDGAISRWNHWVLWHEQQLFCPNRGVYKKLNWMELTDRNHPRKYISSYYEIVRL